MSRTVLSSNVARDQWGTTKRLAKDEKEIVVKNHSTPELVISEYAYHEQMKLKAQLYDCETVDEQLAILVPAWGRKLAREAAAKGGSMNEDEFLAWSVEVAGQEFVDAALNGESANAVGG